MLLKYNHGVELSNYRGDFWKHIYYMTIYTQYLLIDGTTGG